MKIALLIGGGLFWFIAAWSGGVPGAAAGLLFLLPGLLVPRTQYPAVKTS